MNWVEQFVEATDGISSPLLFRKWAGISAVAGALERKVWFVSARSVTYPNLYTVLVGPPGVGKTEVIFRVRALWSGLKTHHVAASSVTKASLIDNLNEATRHISRPNEVPAATIFNSILIASNELGVLLPTYDTSMMNVLQDLYDCKSYEETRRGKDLRIAIRNPQVHMLAGCTPSYLNGVLPEGAWDQGFTARTIFVYSGEPVRVPLFGATEDNSERWDELQQSLKKIAALYGQIHFTPDAADLAQRWHDAGGPPEPDHPRLFHYNTRRILQMLKLAVVASCASSDQLVVEDMHVAQAIDWLSEVEAEMPEIFKAMGGSSHSQLIEDIYYFVLNTYNKAGKKPVHKARVFNFVQQRTPAHNVEKVLDIMKKAGVIEENALGYEPKAKQV